MGTRMNEPRYKRKKWSADPNNLTWAKDQNRYSVRQMEKYGWKEGKGLGANLNGRTTNIRVIKKVAVLGLGASNDYTNLFVNHLDSILQQMNRNEKLGGDPNTAKLEIKENKPQYKMKEGDNFLYSTIRISEYFKNLDYLGRSAACKLGFKQTWIRKQPKQEAVAKAAEEKKVEEVTSEEASAVSADISASEEEKKKKKKKAKKGAKGDESKIVAADAAAAVIAV